VEGVRWTVSIVALLLLGPRLFAQEKKPWEIDRLCGKLDHVVRTPDRKNPSFISEKRTGLRDIQLTLFERHDDQACCESSTAIETVRTGRGGHFEFKRAKAGNYWLSTNWKGREYTITVSIKPEKNSMTMCSQQGVDLDDEGDAGCWATVTVD
jgi:hypothetical protein